MKGPARVLRRSAAIGGLSRVLRKPWYNFWRLVERRLYEGHEYTLQVPHGHRVFTPWYAGDPQAEFSRVLREVRAAGPMTVSTDRCFVLYQWLRRCLGLEGAVAECGVNTGGTAHLLALLLAGHARQARRESRELHLFDTFTGMPDLAVPQRDYHSPGDFSQTSLRLVRDRLGDLPFLRFHPGVMPGTFAEVRDVERFSFVHIDVDIYPSVLACCQWFWPRMCPGGVMVFDDYGFWPYRHAARAAVDEFFAGTPEDTPLVSASGQAIALKR